MTDAPDPRDASPDDGKVRRIPPLAWVILALLVLIMGISLWQYGGSHSTPSGGDIPQARPEATDGVMPPPAPATAPADVTPAG